MLNLFLKKKKNFEIDWNIGIWDFTNKVFDFVIIDFMFLLLNCLKNIYHIRGMKAILVK